MNKIRSFFTSGQARWIALMGLVAICFVAVGQTTVREGKLDFSLYDLKDAKVTNKDERFKGKVMLVDLWGTWCPPCQEEVGFLVRMDEKYRQKGLEIVGVAFEKEGTDAEKKARLQKYVEDRKIKYTILFAGSPVAVRKCFPDLQGFGGFPTSIFIDRNGKVRRIETGFNPSAEEAFENMINRLLDEKAGEKSAQENPQ